MKIIKFHKRITIMKILQFQMCYENREHLRILVENNENQENLKRSIGES